MAPESSLRSYLTLVERESAIPVLDGLRAIAIWLVVLRHGVTQFYSTSEPLLPIGTWDAATVFVNG